VNELISVIISKLNFWVYIVLMMIGLYAMISKKNLVKKIIGMNILQTAVILFFISDYINPLPHVLMLTAIVVAVATLGVALALVVKVYQQFQTLDEDEILALLEDE
jgi:multicomponent Na+:H+ antiporter subunit C